MKIEDLQKELQELNNSYQQKFKELSEKIVNIQKETNKIERFKPKDKQQYYNVNSKSDVENYHWTNDRIDNIFYETYNCFQTEEEADEMSILTKNYFKVIYYLKAVNGDWKPDWTNSEKIKYFITFREEVGVVYDVSWSYYKTLSFKSEEARKSFRECVTDDEIKIFLNPMGVE